MLRKLPAKRLMCPSVIRNRAKSSYNNHSSNKYDSSSTTPSSSQHPPLKYGSQAIQYPLVYNDFSNDSFNLSNWLLTKIPKGFGKFYPKDGEAVSETIAAEKPKADPSSSSSPSEEAAKGNSEKQSDSTSSNDSNNKYKSNNGGSSGGGSGNNSSGNGNNKKNKSPTDVTPSAQMIGAAALVALLGVSLINDYYYKGKEISWQEFQTHLLESGEVDRLIVTNKNVAKVVLRSHVKLPGENGTSLFDDGSTTSAATHVPRTPSSSGGSGTGVEFGYAADGTKEKDPNFRYPRLGVAPGSHMPYFFAIG